MFLHSFSIVTCAAAAAATVWLLPASQPVRQHIGICYVFACTFRTSHMEWLVKRPKRNCFYYNKVLINKMKIVSVTRCSSYDIVHE